MMLLDLDPNLVKPGWTPLLITIGLALVMVFLFRSMRRQFRRVDENFPLPPVPGPDGEAAPREQATGDTTSPPASTGPGRTPSH